MNSRCVMQVLPALNVGGVERGTLEIAAALVAAGHRAIVVSAGGRLVEELENLGALHIRWAIGAKSIRTLGLVRPLRKIIEQHRVDIVHARSRLPAWIAYRAINGIPRNQRPRWLTTVHGPYTVNRYSRIMVSGERVIAISEFIRDYIEQNYARVDASNIRVIPRGIDRAHYPHNYSVSPQWRAAWYARYPETRDKRLLVLPGRLTRWKGQTDFIELVTRLVALGEPVHGLIAGGAGRRGARFEEELREIVARAGISTSISFLGHRDDLRDVLAHANIAYSLTKEPEAFGRTTAEALSLGTPVIGYDHGGTGEILQQILPSGLVTRDNIDAAVKRTQQFLVETPLVPSDHRYSLDKMQSATLATYEEVLNEPRLNTSAKKEIPPLGK